MAFFFFFSFPQHAEKSKQAYLIRSMRDKEKNKNKDL